MRTFLEYLTLVEQISGPELQKLADIIANQLSGKYQIQRVLLARDVMSGNPKITEIEVHTGKDQPLTSSMFRPEVVFRNYRAVFGRAIDSLSHAEVLKFEFPGFNWFMLLLGFTQDGKKGAHMAFKNADMATMTSIGNYLKSQGYVLFPQMTKAGENFKALGDENFIYKLLEIFRPAAGMSFSAGMWTKIYHKFEKLKAEHPKEWADMQKVKFEVYGTNVKAVRKMDNLSKLTLVSSGKLTPTSQIPPGSLVYYPLGHPSDHVYFSQWSDGEDEHADDYKLNSAHAIPSQGQQTFECNIPTERIIVGHRMLPAAGSTQVFEREIVVAHPATEVEAKTYDPGLVCKLIKNSAYQG